ncbi:UNKNOWN [Stylonychia lemnae]|uniref:Uncharacterized protein n=1 Tax=Stylonychia lemnae TaxID=5949 RepID=A0A078ANX0_STYLE|nr:UNKNOWN [Stylonychia lemnae]|eukprot:CDW83849.1 UNKNOWN [Stylonychia lemnae]
MAQNYNYISNYTKQDEIQDIKDIILCGICFQVLFVLNVFRGVLKPSIAVHIAILSILNSHREIGMRNDESRIANLEENQRYHELFQCISFSMTAQKSIDMQYLQDNLLQALYLKPADIEKYLSHILSAKSNLLQITQKFDATSKKIQDLLQKQGRWLQ